MITSNTGATDRRPRVLCVDDDAFMLSVLSRTIGVDYEVLTTARNEGLSSLRELRGQTREFQRRSLAQRGDDTEKAGALILLTRSVPIYVLH